MKRLLAALFAASLIAGPAEAGSRLDEYRSGYWTVYAWADDDGAFAFCAIETAVTDGTVVNIGINSRGMFLYLFNDQWAIPEGRSYPLSIAIDNRYRASHVGAGRGDGRSFAVELGWDRRFWLAFREGLRMVIQPDRGSGWSLSLRGTRRATDALERCYDVYTTDSNPFD
jgi:hypothetical protein